MLINDRIKIRERTSLSHAITSLPKLLLKGAAHFKEEKVSRRKLGERRRRKEGKEGERDLEPQLDDLCFSIYLLKE